MSVRARRWVVAVVAPCLVVAAAAFAFDAHRESSASTAPALRASSPPHLPRLAMIGDSVTYFAREPLVNEFHDAGWDADIQARPGDQFRERQPVAEQIAQSHPEVVVISLGTNDALCLWANRGETHCRFDTFDAHELATDMQSMIDVFPSDSTCVVGVLPTSAPEPTLWWQVLLAQHRVDGLVDWGSYSRARPELLVDFVGHLNPQGQAEYGRLVVDEVVRICGEPSVRAPIERAPMQDASTSSATTHG